MKDYVTLSKLLGNRNISIYEILRRFLYSASNMKFTTQIVMHKFQVFRDILSRLSSSHRFQIQDPRAKIAIPNRADLIIMPHAFVYKAAR